MRAARQSPRCPPGVDPYLRTREGRRGCPTREVVAADDRGRQRKSLPSGKGRVGPLRLDLGRTAGLLLPRLGRLPFFMTHPRRRRRRRTLVFIFFVIRILPSTSNQYSIFLSLLSSGRHIDIFSYCPIWISFFVAKASAPLSLPLGGTRERKYSVIVT